MKFNKPLFVALATLTVTPAVLAQDSGNDLEEIIVTASQFARTEAQLAGSINVLTGDELDRELASNLGATLQNQLGVHSASFGPGVGLPVIRGQSGGRVEVLQNNTVVADVSDTSQDHAVGVEAFLVDRIEILRGPTTLRFGAGAIGGVVNLIDNRIHDERVDGVDGAVRVGFNENNDEGTIAGKVDVGVGGWVFHADGFIRDGDDVEIPGLADLDAEPGETTDGFIANTSAEADSLALGASYVGDTWDAGVSVSQLNNDYGIPQTEEEEFVRIDIDQLVYQGKVSFRELGGFINAFDIDLSLTDYEHQESEFELEDDGEIEEAAGTFFGNDAFELRAELAHKFASNWNGTFGLQYQDRDFEVLGSEAFLPPSTTDRLALFVIESIDLGVGILDFGLRFEDQALDADELGEIGNIDHNTLNLSASYVLPVTDNQRLGFTIGRSERAPTAEELTSFGFHIATDSFEVGDTTLDTEDAFNLEVSWALEPTDSGISVGASVFFQDYSNYIFLQNSGLRFPAPEEEEEEEEEEGPALNLANSVLTDACFDEAGFADPENAIEVAFDDGVDCFQFVEDGAQFFGAEAELGIIINDQHSLRFWGDFVRAESDDSGDVPRIPPGRLGASWAFEQNAWNAGVDIVNAFDQNNPGFEEEETDGYVRLDASVGWTSEDFTVFIQATNLTDEDIRNSTSFLREVAPEAGRAFSVGASYRF